LQVKYDDGDEEELEWTELKPTLVHTDRKPLSFKSMLRARNMAARRKVEDQSTSSKDDASKVNQTRVFHEAGSSLNDQRKSLRLTRYFPKFRGIFILLHLYYQSSRYH